MPENDISTRVYEFSYLVVPTLAEEALPTMVGSIKARLGADDASTISEEAPRMITLAYPMTRVIENRNTQFSTAYFGWVKFSSTPEAAEALTKAFERDESIIRFLLIKTVEESTIAPKKLGERPGARRREDAPADAPKEAAPVAEAPKEEAPAEAAPETN